MDDAARGLWHAGSDGLGRVVRHRSAQEGRDDLRCAGSFSCEPKAILC